MEHLLRLARTQESQKYRVSQYPRVPPAPKPENFLCPLSDFPPRLGLNPPRLSEQVSSVPSDWVELLGLLPSWEIIERLRRALGLSLGL